jgi:hypothetical protein
MAEQMVKMIKVFSQWLPDMDILFNENDECRLVIPWAEKQVLLQEEVQSRIHEGKYVNWFPQTIWPGMSYSYSTNLRTSQNR